MYKMKCKDPEIESKCRRLSCVHPTVCKNLNTDHGPVIDLMRQVREQEGVKHVFIASGVRYDLAERSAGVRDRWPPPRRRAPVGGARARSDRVLEKMKKPGIASFERFREMFACASKEAGKEQYDIPYFISGHPGCDLTDMVELALWLKSRGLPAAPGAGLHPHAPCRSRARCTTRASTRSPMEPVLHGARAAREEAPEGAADVLEPRALGARARGAGRRRARRSHRCRPRRSSSGSDARRPPAPTHAVTYARAGHDRPAHEARVAAEAEAGNAARGGTAGSPRGGPPSAGAHGGRGGRGGRAITGGRPGGRRP
jgi:hypothetical protein